MKTPINPIVIKAIKNSENEYVSLLNELICIEKKLQELEDEDFEKEFVEKFRRLKNIEEQKYDYVLVSY